MEDYRRVIRNKREKIGWSQYKLAKVIGITQSFMNEIESGKKAPLLRCFSASVRRWRSKYSPMRCDKQQ